MSNHPRSILSAYRLLLRVSSASVGHHSTAARVLKRTYRPFFEALRRAHVCNREMDLGKGSPLKGYWHHCDTILDRSLVLLVNAAVVQGTPCKVLKNLTQVAHSDHIQRQRRLNNQPRWIPHLEPRFYEGLSSGQLGKTDRHQAGNQAVGWMRKLKGRKSADEDGPERVASTMSDALEEVKLMAELTLGVSLGTGKNIGHISSDGNTSGM